MKFLIALSIMLFMQSSALAKDTKKRDLASTGWVKLTATNTAGMELYVKNITFHTSNKSGKNAELFAEATDLCLNQSKADGLYFLEVFYIGMSPSSDASFICKAVLNH